MEEKKQSKGKKILKGIGIFFLIMIVISVLFPKTEKPNNQTQATQQETAQVQEPKEQEQPEAPSVPKEYENALKKAQTYSDTMYMSKKGLYEQLTSEYGEQFPAEAAQYAVDNVNADFKENALKKAKTYQNDMSMSKQAIYDQLVSEYGEQFTEEEAQYAINNLE